jgi:hypothetical protein
MPGNRQPGGQVVHGTLGTEDMLEILNRTPLRMTDGRELQYTDGVLDPQPQPDAVVARLSGNASVFYDQTNSLATLIPKFLEDPELFRLNQILGAQEL